MSGLQETPPYRSHLYIRAAAEDGQGSRPLDLTRSRSALRHQINQHFTITTQSLLWRLSIVVVVVVVVVIYQYYSLQAIAIFCDLVNDYFVNSFSDVFTERDLALLQCDN